LSAPGTVEIDGIGDHSVCPHDSGARTSESRTQLSPTQQLWSRIARPRTQSRRA
jgi:hypothetical protein